VCPVDKVLVSAYVRMKLCQCSKAELLNNYELLLFVKHYDLPNHLLVLVTLVFH